MTASPSSCQPPESMSIVSFVGPTSRVAEPWPTLMKWTSRVPFPVVAPIGCGDAEGVVVGTLVGVDVGLAGA